MLSVIYAVTFSILMLGVLMLGVVMLYVIILCVILPNVLASMTEKIFDKK